jgi:flagellar biosynthesis chaperone FliJ
MGFRFRLQNLLRLQQSLERKQLARLQQAATFLYQAQHAQQEIRSAIDEAIPERQKLLSNGSRGAEMFLLNSCVSWSDVALNEASKRTESAARYWSAELASYRNRKMEIEKLLAIRNAHYVVYQTTEAKREQAEADELHSLRLQRETHA